MQDKVTPKDIYTQGTKAEIVDFCKQEQLRIIDFRVPREGDLYLGAVCGNDVLGPVDTAGITWAPSEPRLIVERT